MSVNTSTIITARTRIPRKFRCCSSGPVFCDLKGFYFCGKRSRECPRE